MRLVCLFRTGARQFRLRSTVITEPDRVPGYRLEGRLPAPLDAELRPNAHAAPADRRNPAHVVAGRERSA